MAIYDAWLDFRDRCLTSPAFHKFALKFPLTRPVVRKRQSEVFDVVSGFVYSQILFACVELKVFDAVSLRNGGMDLDMLARYCDLDLDAARRLGDGAVSLRLLEKRNDLYRLGDLGAALSINKGALAMIRHHHALYRDMADPVAMLRSGRAETNLSRYWDYARKLDPASSSAQEVSEYSQLMSESQNDVSNEVLAVVNFAKYRKLLDVGGGQGTFLRNVGAKFPDLRLALFDLPEVAKRAEMISSTDKEDFRIECHGGSFFDDPIPQGADLISLVRILHDHDDEPVRQILKSVYSALEPGGELLIAEPMSTGGHAHRISDAYFNFYLHAMGSGRPRSPDFLQELALEAGFTASHVVPSRSPFTCSVILATK
jgi:demethylspheroidene O-methyltransferase